MRHLDLHPSHATCQHARRSDRRRAGVPDPSLRVRCRPRRPYFFFDFRDPTFEVLRMAETHSTMLPLGTVAPDFALPDTQGKMVSLADFKRAPALLVMFICNHCPYVKHIRSEVARLAREYQPQSVAIIGISSNDAEKYPDDRPAKMAEEVRLAG